MSDSVSTQAYNAMAAAGPEWVLALTVCFLLFVVVFKLIPIYKASRERRDETEANKTQAQIDLEHLREQRKAKEEEKAKEQEKKEESKKEGPKAKDEKAESKKEEIKKPKKSASLDKPSDYPEAHSFENVYLSFRD